MDATTATPTQPTSSYTITVLPMLALGAPMGVLVFDDLDPASLYSQLEDRVRTKLQSLASTVNGHTNTIHMYLYHVDLGLDAFPGQTSWRFLSTKPLSQLLHYLDYPQPAWVEYGKTIHDCFGCAPDVTKSHDPPRVIHVVAEIVEVDDDTWVPERYSPHRRWLEEANPAMFAQLHAFLSSPCEPIPSRKSARLGAATTTLTKPAAPFRCAPPYVVSNVPVVAGLTLPENKLFIRKADVRLLDKILCDLPDKKRFVYVAATSGAGKTAFLWSILHILCNRGRSSCGARVAPPMDIVLDVPGLFVLIDTAGQMFTGPRGECFQVELLKKETLYLVDLAHGDHKEVSRPVDGYYSPGEYYPYSNGADGRENHEASHQDGHLHTHVGHPSRILMCLPRRYVDYCAGQHDKFDLRVLPPWNSSELELCRRACFPSLEPSLLTARIKQWGFQPQWTLAMDPAKGVGKHLLVDRLGDETWLSQLMKVVKDNGLWRPDEDEFSKLLVLCSPSLVKRPWYKRSEHTWWHFEWCSDAVRDVVLQRVLDLHHGTESLPPLLANTAVDYMEAIGWIQSRDGLRCDPPYRW